MEKTFLHQWKSWDRRMNGLPRKALLIALSLLGAAVLFLVLPYVLPFLLALLFAAMLEPLIRFLTKPARRWRVSRTVASLIGMLLLFGVAGAIAGVAVTRLSQELLGLMRSTPQLIAWISDVAFPYFRGLYEEYRLLLPGYLLDMVQSTFSSLGQSLIKAAGTLSAALTSGAFTTALSIPSALLTVVLTIMGTYYLSADRERVRGYFRRTIPVPIRDRLVFIRQNLLDALFKQLKSQLIVSLIGTIFLTLAFVIYGIPYGFIIGVLIGVADALPVLGAGLFLIPWSLFHLIGGEIGTGIFLACAYVGIIVIRQVAEPRIVGRNLGLYPLTTMISIYAGYRLMGFVGLLAGPVLLNIMKAVLEADALAQK
ncbi:MAG: sporulation integral membrane protein YtvI [Eubacteriales bacterium]|nr:sporulation integral membrane protein YtvI [Eubacteriales bacterium]